VQEEFQHITDEALTDCEKCGARGSLHTVPTAPHTQLEYHKPIEMFSIGLTDDEEILAFKGQCPDVDVSMDPSDEMYGIPVARTRQQKLQALRAVGFEEKS